MKHAHPQARAPHLSVVSNSADNPTRLSRAQVAERIGASVATVRRYEKTELTPEVDENGVHWFNPTQVTALAAKRANEALAHGRIRNTRARPAADERTKGEIAALVFERFEQRQSQAEIVIGLRIEPELVQHLFDQWCLGLIERQLRKPNPNLPHRNEAERASVDELRSCLGELPQDQITRISVGRWRGEYASGDLEYNEIAELGGFHVSGPCPVEEITRRYGPGDYRITAYGFEPPGLRWELLVEGLPSC